jgi:hypothetical protein
VACVSGLLLRKAGVSQGRTTVRGYFSGKLTSRDTLGCDEGAAPEAGAACAGALCAPAGASGACAPGSAPSSASGSAVALTPRLDCIAAEHTASEAEKRIGEGDTAEIYSWNDAALRCPTWQDVREMTAVCLVHERVCPHKLRHWQSTAAKVVQEHRERRSRTQAGIRAVCGSLESLWMHRRMRRVA